MILTSFIKNYKKSHNDKLWERYRNGYIKVDDSLEKNVAGPAWF